MEPEEERRDAIGRRLRVFRVRSFAYSSPEYFRERFRLREVDVEAILHRVGPMLQHDTDRNFALSPKQQLLLALRFLATGTLYHMAGDGHGLSKATVCRVIRRVCKAVLRAFLHVIRFPQGEALQAAEARYRAIAGLPEVIGCIDGTHVNMRVPVVQQEVYLNRHHRTSMNVMAVAGADLTFSYVSVHAPGRWHDSRVMRESGLPPLVARGVLGGKVTLGDSAYPILPWLMPPYPNPDTPAQERFNNANHAITRCTVERSFGMLKMRWQCLLERLRCQSVETNIGIVMTCFVLHNLCTRAGDNGDWLVAANPAQAAAPAAAPLAEADAAAPEPAAGEADQRRRGQARRNGLAQRLG